MWWARHLPARNISYFPISWWHTPRCFTAWRRNPFKRPKAFRGVVSETRLAEESYAMKQENHNSPGIAEEVLAVLRCLFCKASLRQRADALVCEGCGRTFPFLRGVARFVDAQHYAGSFGFQWQVFARTQLDTGQSHRSEVAFRRRTGFSPEDLAGKLVLDVGCGMGRFADVATRWGARVVGVDLSAAAEVAARNLAGRDFRAFQADVFNLPFAVETFDCIYSIGVLHHTPDCEAAVKVLAQYLRPGGSLAVWLYSGYNKWYRFSDLYRKITHRMSPTLLHKC